MLLIGVNMLVEFSIIAVPTLTMILLLSDLLINIGKLKTHGEPVGEKVDISD
jgi:hypothetical protein